MDDDVKDTRRTARMQALPEEEVQYLRTLNVKRYATGALHVRARELYNAGWSLQAIGDAVNPSHARSAIRAWVIKADQATPAAHIVSRIPIPHPDFTITRSKYVSRRPASPGISSADKIIMSDLARLARHYRAGMSPTNPYTRANNQFTEMCSRLHARNVTVRELSNAANVTYRAIARRLGK